MPPRTVTVVTGGSRGIGAAGPESGYVTGAVIRVAGGL
jgi:hypothetical protein